jgi:hypothetical protein
MLVVRIFGDSEDNLRRKLIVLHDIEVIFVLDIVIMRLTTTVSELYKAASLARCTLCPKVYIRSRGRLRCCVVRKFVDLECGAPRSIRTSNNTLLWGSRHGHHPLILRKPPIMQHNPFFPTHQPWQKLEKPRRYGQRE